MPNWNKETPAARQPLPHGSAFDGVLKVYDIPSNEYELLLYFDDARDEVNKVIASHVSPQKVQFRVEIDLVKPVGEDEAKELPLFSNTVLNTIDGEGLSDDQYLEMVQQVINTLGGFTAHGSGWKVKRLVRFRIKLARFSHIRRRSNNVLPLSIASERSLLSIGNVGGSKCFLFCFTAAFHVQYGPSLIHESPWLYSSRNTSAHQPIGSYHRTIPFDSNGEFENKNLCQINIFWLVFVYE